MDVWINFKNATKWQAEGLFKCFFPFKKPTPPSECDSTDITPSQSQENLTLPKRKNTTPTFPALSEEELDVLAKQFADAIPDDEFSVASLQGYLLKNKTRPRECVNEAAAW